MALQACLFDSVNLADCGRFLASIGGNVAAGASKEAIVAEIVRANPSLDLVRQFVESCSRGGPAGHVFGNMAAATSGVAPMAIDGGETKADRSEPPLQQQGPAINMIPLVPSPQQQFVHLPLHAMPDAAQTSNFGHLGQLQLQQVQAQSPSFASLGLSAGLQQFPQQAVNIGNFSNLGSSLGVQPSSFSAPAGVFSAGEAKADGKTAAGDFLVVDNTRALVGAFNAQGLPIPRALLPVQLSAGIRRKIALGEFTDFAEILAASELGSAPTSDFKQLVAGVELFTREKAPAAKELTSFSQWLQCHTIIVQSLLDSNVSLVRDRVGYLRVMVDFVARYGFPSAYTMDRSNRSYCAQTGHGWSTFKPDIMSVAPSLPAAAAPSSSAPASRKRPFVSDSDSAPNSKRPKRPAVLDGGREVCRNFSLGKCGDPCPGGRSHARLCTKPECPAQLAHLASVACPRSG